MQVKNLGSQAFALEGLASQVWAGDQESGCQTAPSGVTLIV